MHIRFVTNKALNRDRNVITQCIIIWLSNCTIITNYAVNNQLLSVFFGEAVKKLLYLQLKCANTWPQKTLSILLPLAQEPFRMLHAHTKSYILTNLTVNGLLLTLVQNADP